MQFILSRVYSGEDQELIKLLGCVGELKSDYPARLFVVRRAAFIDQVDLLEKANSAYKLHLKHTFT